MRRELRRHPVQGKPGKSSNRPARMPRVGATRPPAGGSGAGPRHVRGLPAVLQPAWFREVLLELRKVQWPTRQETINLTLVVIVVSLALGLFLGGLDSLFNWIIEQTLLS